MNVPSSCRMTNFQQSKTSFASVLENGKLLQSMDGSIAGKLLCGVAWEHFSNTIWLSQGGMKLSGHKKIYAFSDKFIINGLLLLTFTQRPLTERLGLSQRCWAFHREAPASLRETWASQNPFGLRKFFPRSSAFRQLDSR